MSKQHEQHVVTSWMKNASPWITAIRDSEIESRVRVTDQAIIEAILQQQPKTALDIGCGEGWLVRALCAQGIVAKGVDVVPELIEYAQRQRVGEFQILAYDDVSPEALSKRFDVVACNFSLFGDDSVRQLIQRIPHLLADSGAFVVQTLHPQSVDENGVMEEGWQQGSWDGFNAQFSDPAPWYFRPLDAWKALLLENGFKRVEIIEPFYPETQRPASVIFIVS